MRPLEGARVVDLTDGRGEGCGRLLADLGADLLLVEPPGGVSSRRALPMHRGQSLNFLATAANKHSIELDLSARDGRDRLLTLLAGADIGIDGTDPGTLATLDLAAVDVTAWFPHLVIVSIMPSASSAPTGTGSRLIGFILPSPRRSADLGCPVLDLFRLRAN